MQPNLPAHSVANCLFVPATSETSVAEAMCGRAAMEFQQVILNTLQLWISAGIRVDAHPQIGNRFEFKPPGKYCLDEACNR